MGVAPGSAYSMKTKVLAGVVGIFLGAALLSINGCSNSTPTCSASETKALVSKIIEDNYFEGAKMMLHVNSADNLLRKKFAAYLKDDSLLTADNKTLHKASKKILNLKLSDIVTTSVDDKLKKASCSVKIEIGNKGSSWRINYKLSRTDEGKLYAEVFGINNSVELVMATTGF